MENARTEGQPTREDVQRLMEDLERDGMLERTGEVRDGLPVYALTEAGRAEAARQRWEHLEDGEVLALSMLVLAADGQEFRDGEDESSMSPNPEIVRELADELGEVITQRGLAERVSVE